MKASEVRALSDEEISKKLEEAYEQLLNLRFRLATRQLTNHNEISRVKREIARLKTVLKERELG